MSQTQNVTVVSMVQLNKRHYQLWFGDAQYLQLRIEGMFEVLVTHGVTEVARIHFQPLSSLNNLEMQPVYRVAAYQVSRELVADMASGLLESALAIYAYYTQGMIKPLRVQPGTVVGS